MLESMACRLLLIYPYFNVQFFGYLTTYATYDSEYEGKLLVVIGDTSPLLTASFIWRKGSVEEVTKQTMKQIKKEMRVIDRLARQHAKQGL